jgi:hypothetical protein
VAASSHRQWPNEWKSGARSAVEPFVLGFFGIELGHAWRWLVAHGELEEFPDAAYCPIADAEEHLRVHSTAPCRHCAVWHVLLVLWTIAFELYAGRDAREVHQRCVELERLFEELLAYARTLEPGHIRVRLQSEFLPLVRAGPEVANAADRLSRATLDCFGLEARELVLGARPQVIVNRICHSLRRAGFSYAEIARLIGDRSPGARERVRKRCKRPTG